MMSDVRKVAASIHIYTGFTPSGWTVGAPPVVSSSAVGEFRLPPERQEPEAISRPQSRKGEALLRWCVW
jgi:hypothetical protein